MTDVVPQPPPPANRGLWILVITLGIAILVVIAAMIGMTIRRSMNGTPIGTPANATAAPSAVPSPGTIPELNLDLEPGTTVTAVQPDGDRLIIRTTAPKGEEILIVDPARGQVLSRVRLNYRQP